MMAIEIGSLAIGIPALAATAAGISWESIEIRRNIRKDKVPAAVLTPLTEDWYASEARRLLSLTVGDAEKQLAEMGRGVAATVRMVMLQMGQLPEAA